MSDGVPASIQTGFTLLGPEAVPTGEDLPCPAISLEPRRRPSGGMSPQSVCLDNEIVVSGDGLDGDEAMLVVNAVFPAPTPPGSSMRLMRSLPHMLLARVPIDANGAFRLVFRPSEAPLTPADSPSETPRLEAGREYELSIYDQDGTRRTVLDGVLRVQSCER